MIDRKVQTKLLALRRRYLSGCHPRRRWGKKAVSIIHLQSGKACWYCLKALPLAPRLGVWEIDHVEPWTRGGADAIHNLVASCVECNRSKGDDSETSFRRRRKIKARCHHSLFPNAMGAIGGLKGMPPKACRANPLPNSPLQLCRIHSAARKEQLASRCSPGWWLMMLALMLIWACKVILGSRLG